MGCIPSKAVTRSLSFQEELNRGFQRTSHNANDQFLAFVYSAHTTNEVKNRDPKAAVETAEIAKRKADAENSLLPQDAVRMNHFERLSKSKSCQMIPDKEFSMQDPQNEGLSENKLDWRDKNTGGSRSFHTVEEYDALIKRIYMSSTRDGESFQDNESLLDENVHTLKSMDEDCNDGNNHRNAEDFMKNKSNINEGPSEHTSSSLKKSDDFENFVREGALRETGWKRKAVGQGLKSPDVSPIEFPAIARHKQWFHVDGQVYSPGTYVTPKFGSYNKVNPVRREDGNDSVFSPEAVAAFEVCMQQLDAEEESILSYIDGYLQGNNKLENQIEEDCKIKFMNK
ncbi:unnamed protein product [Fraxinus pennsylvanica]|uniref:Uncharacterized protein n=1 Tax=Fraxinus pennsylvanica TaxID=56036 RepID=A0AAD1YVF0_9LAMI|nr:unnamed protein product [Fraxinus pennsylvanica]